MKIEEQFSRALTHLKIPPGLTALLALSGGGDSMALLLLASKIAKNYPLKLLACRVVHGIRDQEEEENENKLCYEATKKLAIPLRIKSLPSGTITQEAKKAGRGVEQAAREARHAALELCRKEEGADCILYAHTADDNLETVMMRLLTGSGPEGLKGIPPCRGKIFRPMMGMKGSSLRAYLQAQNFPWAEDLSNQEGAYRRNRVRRELLPLVEDIFPGWASALGVLSQRSQELNQALSVLGAPLLPYIDAKDCRRWPYAAWMLSPPYLQARALWDAFDRLGKREGQDYRWSWRSVSVARQAAERGGPWFGLGLRLERQDEELVLRHDPRSSSLQQGHFDMMRFIVEEEEVKCGLTRELEGFSIFVSFDAQKGARIFSGETDCWPLEISISAPKNSMEVKDVYGRQLENKPSTERGNKMIYILINEGNIDGKRG